MITAPSVTAHPFENGTLCHTLTGLNGLVLKVLDYGGIVQQLLVPNPDGSHTDIAVCPKDMAGHRANPYFGSIIGRYANRIANGTFSLDGKTYTLATNNPPNALHGGPGGFDKVIWKTEPFREDDTAGLRLTHVSPDGHEGYPGRLCVTVTYRVLPGNVWRIDYEAVTDAPTVLNFTNHLFFNLKGQGGTIHDHCLQLESDFITPVNAKLIPTGELRSVQGTVFDFTRPRLLGQDIDSPDEQIRFGSGYDHNFVLRGKPGTFRRGGLLSGGGRSVEFWTTEPAVQLYTGNFIPDGLAGKQIYPRRGGVCLETQHYPDSPNQPAFPAVTLRPGEKFHSITEYRFN